MLAAYFFGVYIGHGANVFYVINKFPGVPVFIIIKLFSY